MGWKHNEFYRILTVVALVVSVAGCGGKKEPTAPYAYEQEPIPSETVGREYAVEEEPVGEALTIEEQELEAKQQLKKNALQTGALEDIRFDFNHYQLSKEAQQSLQKTAQWMMDHPEVDVLIEGHCDERGSQEYNLALGERRAVSVEKYLRSLGIADERMETVSYGEERPVDPRSNEEAWAKNRRAHFEITSL